MTGLWALACGAQRKPDGSTHVAAWAPRTNRLTVRLGDRACVLASDGDGTHGPEVVRVWFHCSGQERVVDPGPAGWGSTALVLATDAEWSGEVGAARVEGGGNPCLRLAPLVAAVLRGPEDP